MRFKLCDVLAGGSTIANAWTAEQARKELDASRSSGQSIDWVAKERLTFSPELIELRARPECIVVDNEPEFSARALDAWAYEASVQLHNFTC